MSKRVIYSATGSMRDWIGEKLEVYDDMTYRYFRSETEGKLKVQDGELIFKFTKSRNPHLDYTKWKHWNSGCRDIYWNSQTTIINAITEHFLLTETDTIIK